MASIADVYVTVLPETARLKEEIRRVVDAEERRGIKKKVEANTVDAKKELERFRVEQERKKIRQKIEFDEGDLGDKLKLIGKKFDGIGAKFGSGLKWNLGLAGIGTLPAAATAITNVAGAIQQLSGAGLVLPGVFAGIASSVGVTAISMHGMKDALEAVNKASDGTQKSVDAANAALGKLAPNQAEVIKTTVGLKGTFEDLSRIGGQNMFAGVSGGLRTLVGNLLPAATRGIDGISRAINQNLLQGMTSLGSSSSQGILGRIFGNTAQAQSLLTRAIDPVIHAFGTLAAVGSDTLPRLATAVGAVAERFNSFITGAADSGKLSTWINDGITGFTQLGNIALNLGKSFVSITQAAGGGAGLLGTLESLTSRMATFLGSTEGQNRLRDFFAQGRQQLSQLKDIAVQLGPILAGVFRAATTAAGLWLPVIRQVLAIINSIPGGAQAVVTAFVAWKTIQGPIALLNTLTNISTLLSGGLPGAAARGAGGISAALAGVTVPAWLSYLVAGGSVAAVGSGLSAAHEQGLSPEVTTRFPELRNPRSGTVGPPAAPNIPGGGGPGAQVDRRGYVPPGYGLPPPALSPQGPGAQAARRGGLPAGYGLPPGYIPPSGVTVPGVSEYAPPVVTEAPKGGGGGGSGAVGAATVPLIQNPDGSWTSSDPAWAHLIARESGGNPTVVNNSDSNAIAGDPSRGLFQFTNQTWLRSGGGKYAPRADLATPQQQAEIAANLIGSNPTGSDWGAGLAGRESASALVAGVGKSSVSGAGSSPLGAVYPSSDYVQTGDPTTDKRMRESQQRVDDTQQRIESSQMRLDELNAKGTTTAKQRADAEYALAKAKREHADAQTDLNTAVEKGGTGKGGASSTGGEQLGQDILSGMGEVFGLGTLFKDPTQFGLFKLFKGIMGLSISDKGSGAGSGGGGLGGSGSGGGGIGGLLSLVSQPFGNLNIGSPGNAPGEFLPNLGPGGGGSGGGFPMPGTVAEGQAPAGAPAPGAPGSPGPGNVNDFRGANFGYSPTAVQDQVNSAHLQHTRQPIRALPPGS